MVTRWSCSTSNFYALIGQNLTGEFTWKIYAASGNLFTDSWSWQSFVSSCDVFNCLFPLDVQNEIQLLSRFFCYSWLVCLLGYSVGCLWHTTVKVQFGLFFIVRTNCKASQQDCVKSLSIISFSKPTNGIVQNVYRFLIDLLPLKNVSERSLPDNIHESITHLLLAEKGVQFFCNTSANYKGFLIGWKHKRNQREPIRLELF